MRKPLALDLFCCAGGSTTGLEAAGFDVIGIDHKPSHHWTGSGEVHEADLSTADAVEAVIRAFAPDFVSSSPPCQRFSTATPTANRADHPDLIASTREGIVRSGAPAWIENVATDAVPFTGFWIMLCGTHVGLWNLKRHRRFELIGWRTQQPYHDNGLCMYERDVTGVYGFVDAPTSERARRNVESIHDGSEMTNSRKARVRRAVVHCAGEGSQAMTTDPSVAKQRHRRLVSTISGDGGCSPGFGGDKAKRAEWRKGKGRVVVTVAGEGWGATPGGSRAAKLRVASGMTTEEAYAQNRPGPECIRWRRAMGWIDGPKDRYSLAQAVPPAYAEWLGRRFLETRAVRP